MSPDDPPAFDVEIASPSDRPRAVIDGQPDEEDARNAALVSTFDPALAKDGKSDAEIMEEQHDAELAIAGVAIVAGIAIAAHLAHENENDADVLDELGAEGAEEGEDGDA
ncbi:MAG: hypothetical protein WDM79_17580 [Terricaulis sp.]